MMLPYHFSPHRVFPGNESQTNQHNKLLVYVNIRPYSRMSKLNKNYFLNKRGGVYNKQGGLHVWLLFNTLGGPVYSAPKSRRYISWVKQVRSPNKPAIFIPAYYEH